MTVSAKRQGSRFRLLFWKKGAADAGLLSKKDRIQCVIEGIMVIVLFAWFFYRSVLALPFLTPVYLLYQHERRKALGKKRQKEAAVQFKDAILSASANQKAGYSIENAFQQAYEDMDLLYGKESMICEELYTIVAGLKNNVPIESLLYDFGKRSGVEDIIEFSQVFAVAKRSGGNLTEIIERSASVIEDKVETEKEIQVVISARQMEQRIMNIVPFGILLYISAASKGFFDMLYKNAAGIIIMSLCMAVYVGAVFLSGKITDIGV